MKDLRFYFIALLLPLSGCQYVERPIDDGKCHCKSASCFQNGGRKTIMGKCSCDDSDCICGNNK